MEALTAWRDAVTVREELARDNPAVTRYQEALPAAWTRLALLHAAGDDRDEATRYARRAEQYWQARPPADATGLYDQARVQAVLTASAASESDGAMSGEQAAAVLRPLAAAVQAGFSHADQIASESVFAGLLLSGESWGRQAHSVTAVILIAVALLASAVAAMTLRSVRGTGRRLALLLFGLAVVLMMQTTVGHLSVEGRSLVVGANLLWLHVPLGVALVALTVQPARVARRLYG